MAMLVIFFNAVLWTLAFILVDIREKRLPLWVYLGLFLFSMVSTWCVR